MPTNFPGPYECRFLYTTTITGVALNHKQHLSVILDGEPDPGDAFSTISAFLSNGLTTAFLDDLCELWVDSIVPFYSNASGNVWNGVELWKYDVGTFNAQFVSALGFTKAGTSATTTQEAAQSIVTFRSTLGGGFKLSFMEPAIAVGSIDPPPFTNTPLEDLCVDVVAGNVYPWIARDQGWPFMRLAHFPGQNEKLFKKRRRAAI